MARPPIPDTTMVLQGDARKKFDRAVKENLEILMGVRGTPITQLPTTASLPDVIVKLNQLITVLQG